MAQANNSQHSSSGKSPNIWQHRRIVVALSGGISCYKIASLVSRSIQADASVRVLMTPAACRFVGPTTFESLSGSPVLTDIFAPSRDYESPHTALAQWCQLMIIAPATADLIAKLAVGRTDDVVCLTACALPASTPVLLAPAMNEQMWQNPITQRNTRTVIETLGYHTVGPDEGWQACRTTGVGRMSEPDQIFESATQLLETHR